MGLLETLRLRKKFTNFNDLKVGDNPGFKWRGGSHREFGRIREKGSDTQGSYVDIDGYGNNFYESDMSEIGIK